MLNPTVSEADAARIALLPLECSSQAINQLFSSPSDPKDEFFDRLDEYGLNALKRVGGPDEPPIVNSIGEIAILNTLTAIRVEFADPLTDTRHYEQFPVNSAERRMMERPLRKHPGLSRLLLDVRDQYIYDVLYAFQNQLGDELQREIVATLVAPDPEWEVSTPSDPVRTYTLVESIRSQYCHRISQYNEGFKIPFNHVTGRTLAEPLPERSYLPTLKELPPLVKRRNGLVVPTDVILAKLANYAWHGWYRLVHLFYNGLSETEIQSFVEATPRIDEEVKESLIYRGPQGAFIPYYGAETQNPLLNPDARDPVSRPDKRLVTIVDLIRASSDLQFGEQILLFQLFDEVCQFFPSPDRPSNDVADKQTLEKALEGAIDDRVEASEEIAAYKIPAPIPTPFHSFGEANLEKQYRHELARLTEITPSLPDSQHISPRLPEEWQPRNSGQYEAELKRAEQAAVQKMKYEAHRIDSVEPLVDPGELKGLRTDEILFLTRIGLAMERRIKSYSLIESMRRFSGTKKEPLDIDIEKLDNQGYLNQPQSRRTYYSVPWRIRNELGIPNVSHDGWGERSPSEGTLHRVGVDLSAFFVATQPEIDQVVRYCDAWRLQNTACWEDLNHLRNKRLDVIGFSGGDVRYICEVETRSGDEDGMRGTIEKLRAFPANVHRLLVTPSGVHLPPLMSRLSNAENCDIDLGALKDGGYRPADVRDELTKHGLIGDRFDDVLTYTNIRDEFSESFDQSNFSDVIVGPI